MKNIELLFEYNRNDNAKSQKKYVKLITKGKSKYWEISNNDKEFNGNNIYKLLSALNYIIETDRFYLPKHLKLNTTVFKDKLVYIILECICYYIINYKNRPVFVSLKPQKSIWTDGIFYSPISFINRDYRMFNYRFKVGLELKHYRKIIKIKDLKTDYLNKVSTDIYLFFNHLDIDDSTNEVLCEAITEIVGNAIEHSNSDCLIDIDVTEDDYYKQDDVEESIYYGINVVVLNFSDKPFHEKLKKKFQKNINLNERYLAVKNAKEYHSKFFNKYYTENDFYSIAAFQHKISGSIKKEMSGGVGLTRLVKSLEEKSNSHICYMLSQNRALFFLKELLAYDENDYIGFNTENDFFNHIPDSEVLQLSATYFPGTAYNLNFAIRKGDINNEK